MAGMTSGSGRLATDADAVLGARPEVVFEPSSVEEAAAAVGGCARGRKALAFVGGGTDLEIGGAPERLDAVLRTGRLDRIVEHAPSDQIVVAEAGVTLSSLGKALATHGQRLALDPPSPERATIGGVIAANAFGPLRTRFGSVRDLIIGISVVRSDGTLARGGGKVVKNVAGFDLPKLMAGSLGTLGLIATATFRLHPLPEESVTLLLEKRSPADVASIVARMREAQLEPASVVALRLSDGRFDVAVRFEGFGKGVREQHDRLLTIAARDGWTCEALDAKASAAFDDLHGGVRHGASFRAKLALPAAGCAEAAERALAPLLGALENPGCVLYPTLGLGFLAGDPREVGLAAAAVASLRAAIAARGGSLVVHAASGALRARVGVWGDPPPAVALMKSVKARLDPERLLAPGRFVGGL